jgi:AcrR family transcriptional regulator
VATKRDAKRAATAQRILEAAQEEFALRGYEAATIRSIADRAGVHASLVMQHHGSKAALFAVAVELPEDGSPTASEHLLDVLGVRLADLPPETRALVRSMLTVPEAEAQMRAFLEERIQNLAGSLGGDDAELRATLAVSSILGLTIARHFLRLPAFDRVSAEEMLRAAHEWITTGTARDLDAAPPSSGPVTPGGPASGRPTR